jgi:hypothetical protein
MSRTIPASAYVEYFDPDLSHHRAWLLAVLEQLVAHEPKPWRKAALCAGSGRPTRLQPGLGRLRWQPSPPPSPWPSPW